MMNSQRLCFLLSLCVLAQSNPHLRTSVPSGSRVYVHQPITITCSTRGHILVWESNEYIGLGGQLTFASGDSRGRRANSEINNQTFAVLTSIEPELESQLSLTVASNYQSFTITCRNVDQGLADNVTYITSDNNATQFTKESYLLCPEDYLRLECTARNTSALTLNNNFVNLNVPCQRNDLPVRNTTIAGVEVAVLKVYSPGSLICSFVLKAGELPRNQQLSITCLNVDIGISATTYLIVEESCSTIGRYTNAPASNMSQTDSVDMRLSTSFATVQMWNGRLCVLFFLLSQSLCIMNI